MLNIYTLTEFVAIQPVNTTANPANVTTKASLTRLSGKLRIYMLGLQFFPNSLPLEFIFIFQVFDTLSYLAKKHAHINTRSTRHFIIATRSLAIQMKPNASNTAATGPPVLLTA